MASFFPNGFEERVKPQLQDEWPEFINAHHREPPVSIRINPTKKNFTLPVDPVPWTSSGFYLPQRPVFTLDPSFHAGAYYVQEASSMFLEQAFKQIIPTNKPLRVLDLCAAPGGKSTHIVSLINEASLLVSNEVIRSRVNILGENIQKWGNNNVIVTNNDAADFQRIPGSFDVIVLDAPCSGEGLFRKDPNAKEEWSPSNVDLCSARQRRIIEDVWPALKPGGIMIYSTCTYNEQEDEDAILWLKQNHGVESIRLELDPSWGIQEVERSGMYGYKCFPHRVKGEGFFLSIIQKPETITDPQRVSLGSFNPLSKRIEDTVRTWVRDPELKTFFQRDNTIQFFPTAHFDFLRQVAKNLRVNLAGTFLGTLKHEKIIPEHGLALSSELQTSEFKIVDFDEPMAIQYLRRESLRVDLNYKGFALASFKNLPLGWMNVIPGRINNLYPQEWRIRMSV
jgi:16S rRNA C967 or C1407 C5-methylase (RsmB/RsmF family)/NOL1/NOP2/fmu family ribosome biogenesis protein